jgi:NADH:ubiquinone oxidoreductase subunit 4 (subunit M)
MVVVIKKMKRSSNKFFYIYFNGFFIPLIAILIIYLQGEEQRTINCINICHISDAASNRVYVFAFCAFAIKAPITFHIWLPVAHGESSTGTSVLAAILLSGWLWIHTLVPLFPYACKKDLTSCFNASYSKIYYLFLHICFISF